MSRQFISDQARRFQRKFRDFRLFVNERYGAMDRDSLDVVNDALYQYVGEITRLLLNPSVRGHQDPSIVTPEVHSRSSKDAYLMRLSKQVDAASVLADVTHLGPQANREEAAALSRIEDVLDILYGIISPDASRPTP
ncbi:unnamed protein product [Caenorhabditis sp. 36 PRJEB53466]|nr:unnamed protein product [Caenorhabditis sp. 36 PRJEB53466]